MHLHTGTHDVQYLWGMAVNMDTIYMTWLTGALVFILVLLATRSREMVPSGVQNAVETTVENLSDQFYSILGPDYRKAVYMLLTLFFFIFIGNEIGLLPTPHLITSPTNDVNTTLGLAIAASLATHALYVKNKGFKEYFAHFFKPFAPFVFINLIEEIAKPITLAMRLFGNILAGEILLEVLNYLAPVGVPILWIGVSLVIGLIQAFIFTILVTAYLGGAIGEGGH